MSKEGISESEYSINFTMGWFGVLPHNEIFQVEIFNSNSLPCHRNSPEQEPCPIKGGIRICAV